MRISAVVVLAGVFMTGCASETRNPAGPIVLPVLENGAQSPNANGGNAGTPLSAAEEVMPAGVINNSNARGNAIFHLNADGTELSYKLIVANISNVFQAHIHSAPAGSNGGIVVWLYPSTTPGAGPTGGGRIDGVIAEGVITSANLIGSLAGQPLSALVTLISNSGAYVNVHTNDGVAPTNTGPGDFPGGELRGQIEHRGHRN
jgi:hypothetical protein